ncbi:MAG: helix-turn-helix transcriptional regulator [Lachnospiraceae bacterium]|nr:helix-turn-helix transcriptional regulator [Lachnospiraceae bacterium]
MISDKLKEIRESVGMNKKEFATYIGVKYTTYNGYETGTREPDSDFLIMISKRFDVSIDYILGLQNEKEIKHSYELKAIEYEHIEKYRSLDPRGQETVSYILDRESERVASLQHQAERIAELEKSIPDNEAPSRMRVINYYYRLASAGTGQILFDMPPTKRIEIPDIPEYTKADYAIGVNGNSMEPTYYDGDTLLVEMTDHINVGEIGIFSVDNECFVKELGFDELKSLNPASSNIPLNETAHCMGRVIGKL